MRKYVIKPRIIKVSPNEWTWIWWDHESKTVRLYPKMAVEERRSMVYHANHFVDRLNAKQERLV